MNYQSIKISWYGKRDKDKSIQKYYFKKYKDLSEKFIFTMHLI